MGIKEISLIAFAHVNTYRHALVSPNALGSHGPPWSWQALRALVSSVSLIALAAWIAAFTLSALAEK